MRTNPDVGAAKRSELNIDLLATLRVPSARGRRTVDGRWRQVVRVLGVRPVSPGRQLARLDDHVERTLCGGEGHGRVPAATPKRTADSGHTRALLMCTTTTIALLLPPTMMQGLPSHDMLRSFVLTWRTGP